MSLRELYIPWFTVIFLVLSGVVLASESLLKYLPKGKEKERPKERGTSLLERILPQGDREVVFFLLLMALSVTLRVWRFGSIPGGMNQDGAMAAVDAKALADYGTDRFGTFLPVHFKAWGYGQMSVLMSYCMVPFIKLFGLNAVTARLPILLSSLGGLVALYLICRRLLGVRGAQIALFFAACNPWHFMQSRWALDCNMFPHVFLLGLWFLLKGVEGKRRFLWLSMVFYALCMYSYGIAFYTVPVFLLIMSLYYLWKGMLKLWEVGIAALVYLAITWPIYLTMMINAFGWKTIRTFFCTMPYFSGSVRSGDILFFSSDKGAQFLKNLTALKQVYLDGDGLPWNTVPGYGVITKCFLPFVLLGVIACIRSVVKEPDPFKKAGFVALISYFLVANLSGLITAQVNVNRINILHYSLLIFGGMGIDFSIRQIKMSAWIIWPAYLIISALFLREYFTVHAASLEWYYFHDYVEAVSFAGEQENMERYVITQYVRGEYVQSTSEILTMFAMELDAEFFQGKRLDENGLSYKEKISYADASQCQTDYTKAVAYVMRKRDAGVKSWDHYKLYPFGDYYVAVPEVFAK